MIQSSGPGIKSVEDLLKKIQEKSVFVGVPEGETGREDQDSSVTNAELAYLHTNGVRTAEMRNEMNDSQLPYSKAFQAYILAHGSPLWKIPPRPILQPAIEDESNQKMIAEQLAQVGRGFAESDEKGNAELEKLGLMGQNIVRDWFDNPANGWPENAQSTIDAKKSDRPLIDTGQLRKSMTYVIRGE